MLWELRSYSWTSKKRKQNGKISKNRTKSYFNENDEETLAVGGGGEKRACLLANIKRNKYYSITCSWSASWVGRINHQYMISTKASSNWAQTRVASRNLKFDYDSRVCARNRAGLRVLSSQHCFWECMYFLFYFQTRLPSSSLQCKCLLSLLWL